MPLVFEDDTVVPGMPAPAAPAPAPAAAAPPAAQQLGDQDGDDDDPADDGQLAYELLCEVIAVLPPPTLLAVATALETRGPWGALAAPERAVFASFEDRLFDELEAAADPADAEGAEVGDNGG